MRISFFVLPLLLATAPALAAIPPTSQLIVDLSDDTTDVDERVLEAKLGGLDLQLNSIHSGDERMFVLDVPTRDVERVLAILKKDPRVEVAEPNFVFSLPDEILVAEADGPNEAPAKGPPAPNDPLWSKQWSFRMVGAPAAWARGAKGEGVVVAVIDTGVAFEDYKRFKRVEDLAGTEFVTGYDFVHDDEHPNDDHGHGTHVAGTIAQTTNNGIGVAGLAPKAKIMPLKVLSARGSGTAGDIADAIRFAADEGAHVINMSLGGGLRSLVMQSAVAYARRKGVVVVCAAGNGGRGRVEFPAAYKGAFAVSSVGPTGKLAFYSSWGKQLAMSAPGGDKQLGGDAGAILQNTVAPGQLAATDLYLAFQGTSMATPHVAGAAALIIGAGVTDVDQVEAILKDTAKDAGAKGWDNKYGHGILNVEKAVEAAQEAKGGPWHLGTALLALLAFVMRHRRLLPRIGVGGVLATVMGSSGLYFLACVPVLGVLASPLPAWDLGLFGPSGHFSALWASVFPVLGLSVVLLGVRRARPWLIGLALGWAAHLVVSAISMPTDVLFIPGVASWLDRVWLVVNAGALVVLARLILLVQTRQSQP